MSGGFFRGTSADQDTRFSNKQAKLLKSQKFAPELENLVDMTKVKMDVMRPWIAKRVTELIGFEDEVLINFIYGLLEGKAVNGKQVQISLTGFMERNTGKFMKELWALLLSAQKNVSGVPQQFLDAKEEETKKKKAETDRIANEIQRKKEKEKQEFEEEKTKMDGDGVKSRDKHNELELNVKHEAGDEAAVEKERFKRNGRRRNSRGSQSSGSSYHSPPSRQKRSVSSNKSYCRRYSNGRRSRSISRTPPSRVRSISLERRDRSSPRRSVTPRRRHIGRRSPSPWRRSFHLRRRSRSHSRRRSPSPTRYRVRSPRRHRSRSPLRRRSRSPVRRRSRTPIQRSPGRFRSRTPLRRRSSPMQGRSPSPIRGRSPFFARRRSPSPVRRSSPVTVRRRSRSPFRRRSPSPHRQSPSPSRRQQRRSLSRTISPVRRTSSMHGRKRSLSPESGRSPLQESSSLSPIRRSSLSPVRRGLPKIARSPIQSPEKRSRRREKYSPARRASPNGRADSPAEKRKGTKSVERRPVVSLRSPQRDMLERSELLRERDLSPMEKSPFGSDASRGRSDSEERRSISPRGSPYRKRGRVIQADSPCPLREAADINADHDSSGTSVDDERKFSSRDIRTHRNRSSRKMSPALLHHIDSLDTADTRVLTDSMKSRKTQLPNRDSDRPGSNVDHKEHRGQQGLSTTSKTTALSMKSRESYDDGPRAKDKKIDRTDDGKGGNQVPELEGLHKLSKKSEQNDHNGSLDTPSMENDEQRGKIKEKRKHKKSERKDVESDDYSSSDSYEDRKEVKRRRREEKKLKKEDRRRRRDEKRRRKDERRTEKLKLKSGDAGSLSPDLGCDNSEDEGSKRRQRAGNLEKTESEQKRLEIELREKALESLRAKKGL